MMTSGMGAVRWRACRRQLPQFAHAASFPHAPISVRGSRSVCWHSTRMQHQLKEKEKMKALLSSLGLQDKYPMQ